MGLPTPAVGGTVSTPELLAWASGVLLHDLLLSSSRARIDTSSSIPSSLYEFPNGYNMNLALEKFRLSEGLFDSSSGIVKVTQAHKRHE